MPVEIVDVVHRKDIYQLLEIRNAEIMAAHIYHKRTVGKAWRILHLYGRQGNALHNLHILGVIGVLHVLVMGDRQSLHYTLDAVEDAHMRGGRNGDARLVHHQGICL